MAEQLVFRDLSMSYQKSMAEHQPAKAREAAEQLFAKEPQPWVQVLLAMTWAAEENRDEAFRVLSAAIASRSRSRCFVLLRGNNCHMRCASGHNQSIHSHPSRSPFGTTLTSRFVSDSPP
jgi:hypothetical protein